MALELTSPRTISAPVGFERREYLPWIELAVQVRIVVPEWAVRDEAWVHWAMEVGHSGIMPESARRFDPGLRAATVGAPAESHRVVEAVLDQRTAEECLTLAWKRWCPRLRRNRELGITSMIDEAPEAFRRRCLALFAPALRGGRVAGANGAAALSRIAGAIETIELGEAHRVLLRARAGIGWYAQGIEPRSEGPDLLVSGAVRAPAAPRAGE